MLLGRLITYNAIFLFLLSIWTCAFEDYIHEKTIKLSARFPSGRTSKTEMLTKPSGEGQDYIPAFVDRIEFSASGEECDTTVTRVRDSEGNLSNEFEIETALSGNCTLNVSAYSCSCSIEGTIILPCSDEYCTDEYRKWHKTHEANLDMEGFSSDTANTQIVLDLKKNTGPLDDEPTEIGRTFSLSKNTYQYCLAVAENADFGIAGPSYEELAIGGQITVSKFNKVPFFLSPISLVGNDLVDERLRSCKFYGENFLIPAVINPDFSEPKPAMVYLQEEEGYSPIHVNELNDWSYSSSVMSEQPVIDIGHDFSAILTIGSYGSGNAYFMDFDTALSSTLSESTYTLFNKYRNSLRVIINDPNIITGFGRLNQNGQAVITSRSLIRNGEGEWNYGELNTLTDDNAQIDPEEYLYYSVASNEDGEILLTYQTDSEDIFSIPLNNYGASTLNSKSNMLIRISDTSNQRQPDLSYFDGKYHTVWSDNYDIGSTGNTNYKIFYSALNNEGLIIERNLINSSETEDCFSPKIAINEDGFGVISWINDTGSTRQIYYKRFLF